MNGDRNSEVLEQSTGPLLTSQQKENILLTERVAQFSGGQGCSIYTGQRKLLARSVPLRTNISVAAMHHTSNLHRKRRFNTAGTDDRQFSGNFPAQTNSTKPCLE